MEETKMLRLTLASLAAAAVTLMPVQTIASTYPARTINLVAGFAAGGPTDGMARAFAQKLSAELGVPVVVETRPGADGLLGSHTVKNGNHHGYTIYLAYTAH